MRQTDELGRSLTPFVQGNTLIAVIELSLSSWLVAGIGRGSNVGHTWRRIGAARADEGPATSLMC
jgi:transposase